MQSAGAFVSTLHTPAAGASPLGATVFSSTGAATALLVLLAAWWDLAATEAAAAATVSAAVAAAVAATPPAAAPAALVATAAAAAASAAIAAAAARVERPAEALRALDLGSLGGEPEGRFRGKAGAASAAASASAAAATFSRPLSWPSLALPCWRPPAGAAVAAAADVLTLPLARLAGCSAAAAGAAAVPMAG